MEHTSFGDQRNATFSPTEEDHTVANALRFTLNQDPRVLFCGYSIPHPSEARVNVRVQTTGDPAREVLKDSCQDLMLMCQQGPPSTMPLLILGRIVEWSKLQEKWTPIND